MRPPLDAVDQRQLSTKQMFGVPEAEPDLGEAKMSSANEIGARAEKQLDRVLASSLGWKQRPRSCSRSTSVCWDSRGRRPTTDGVYSRRVPTDHPHEAQIEEPAVAQASNEFSDEKGPFRSLVGMCGKTRREHVDHSRRDPQLGNGALVGGEARQSQSQRGGT